MKNHLDNGRPWVRWLSHSNKPNIRLESRFWWQDWHFLPSFFTFFTWMYFKSSRIKIFKALWIRWRSDWIDDKLWINNRQERLSKCLAEINNLEQFGWNYREYMLEINRLAKKYRCSEMLKEKVFNLKERGVNLKKSQEL